MNRHVARWHAPARIFPSAPIQQPKPQAPNYHVAKWSAPPRIFPSAPVGAIEVRPFSIQPRYTPVTGMGDVAGSIWTMASIAGAAAGAYHGYKRNDSIGWAIVWGLLGSIAPVITVPISLAQGFGEPKRG